MHGCQIALKEHRERLIFAADITSERVEWETLQAGGRNKDVLPVGKRGENGPFKLSPSTLKKRREKDVELFKEKPIFPSYNT